MFKVWAHIEEIDGFGESNGEPIEPVEVGAFDQLADAEGHLQKLYDLRPDE